MAETKATQLIMLFDGVMNMAGYTGLDPATISRMQSTGKRGYHGRIPPRFNPAIIRGARAAGIRMSKVAPLLDPDNCPCCGRTMPKGVTVSASRLRAALLAFDPGAFDPDNLERRELLDIT